MGKVIPFPKKKIEETPAGDVTFKDFAMQTLANDIEKAAQSLAVLFSVELALAKNCALAFQKKLQEDEALIAKTMKIREELDKNENNNVLFLIQECFGASGPEALDIFHGLSQRFKKSL